MISAAPAALAPDTPAHTVDAFHRGRFWLVQPKQGGHRAGMDAMMLAAAVPSSFCGRVADFGAGAGAAGLAVLSRCPTAKTVLVERAPEMAAFAAASLAHPGNAHLSDRATVLVADVTASGQARAKAGLADHGFDFVIMNPPFNAARDRATPDRLRREAHVMEDGLFESWIRSAAAVVRPRGGLAIIARPEQLAAILNAMTGRFGDAELLAVHPRPDAAAIRIVVRAAHGARGRLAIRPPLMLHAQSGNAPDGRSEMIANGLASLFGD
ncbi:tRNA1(Val) (adenine(37)-N6)-methyltransferase [Mesorhizobium sp. ES1-1]|uniref:tRNA1(Val) (adenine(37)-N6)-methyltransferase n=1 Tax=Mesorhizobium sp. ES1-1 TaxID=2876629 RepID=UPI001CC927A5|nr:methyltransferase [Mesorhizobium sp. ES1-1]MBZ9674200.1 methyltransferase [Mesorhizobium sp. ES1-1]